MALAAAPEIPGFRALSPLGYGPTSTIYSAQSVTLGRWVTLTVYGTTLRDEQSQRRFRRGYEVARRLGTHPHAVTVLDFGLTSECQPYVATEIYEHGTLDGQIQGHQPSSVGEVLRMGIALAGALETAHRAGVVHGGVHPARVLLGEDREPALSDLGLVPLVDRTGLAALAGPMTYHASPEVLEGEAPAPPTDVYALASTLYTALAGRAPYAPPSHDLATDDDTTTSLLLRILQHDIPPIDRHDVPPSLEKTLYLALSGDARDRPARPLAFAQALQGCQSELGLAPSQPVVLDVAAMLNVVQEPRADEPAPTASAPAPTAPPAPEAGWTPPTLPAPPQLPSVRLPSITSLPAAASAAPAPAPSPPREAAPASAPPERVFIPYPLPAPEQSTSLAAAPVLDEPDQASRWSPAPAPAEHPTTAPRFDPVPLAPPAERERVNVVDLTVSDRPRIVPEHDPELEPPQRRGTASAPPDALPRTRALPVIVLALLVAVIFAGVTWSIVTGDGSEGERAQPDDPPDTADSGANPVAATRSGLTAVESAVGVQLDWDGRSQGPHVVVILSTVEPPRSLPADTGTALAIPIEDLNPAAGYCFAVVPAPEPVPPAAELAAEIPDDALGPDSCIRSGSVSTVQRG
jgi:serine/threonine protein kinase